MKPLLLVALGGSLGSVARYLFSNAALHFSPGWRFPLGTFVVNILGCLAIGVLSGLVVKHDSFSPEARSFLFTGVIGGFTTFSAFGLETFHLLRRGELWVAGSYVGLSVIVGLLAVWWGFGLVAPRG